MRDYFCVLIISWQTRTEKNKKTRETKQACSQQHSVAMPSYLPAQYGHDAKKLIGKRQHEVTAVWEEKKKIIRGSNTFGVRPNFWVSANNCIYVFARVARQSRVSFTISYRTLRSICLPGPWGMEGEWIPSKISKTTYLDTSHHEHFMTVTIAKKGKKEHMFVAKTKLWRESYQYTYTSFGFCSRRRFKLRDNASDLSLP